VERGADEVRAVPVDAGAAATASPLTLPQPDAAPARRSARRRRGVAGDLIALGLVGVLLVGALAATGAVLYRDLYSPTAFVTRYLDLLSQGRAVDALAVPGVSVATLELKQAGLPTTATEALLRRDALAPLTDITAISEEESDGVTAVTVAYSAGPHRGTSTFQVEPAGWIGIAPAWRFAQSPLAVIDLTVRGAMKFQVNGFEIDKRQVSPDRDDADPLAAVALLAFSPGLYSISVDTAISESAGVAVLSDKPQAQVPVTIQTEPTKEFATVVQEKVESFLTACATQQVLQPTGCPFGMQVANRIVELPTWSIVDQPTVNLAPAGADWAIRRTQAIARIEVDIQNIGTGVIERVDEEVPFFIDGTVTILADGTASIQVAPAD